MQICQDNLEQLKRIPFGVILQEVAIRRSNVDYENMLRVLKRLAKYDPCKKEQLKSWQKSMRHAKLLYKERKVAKKQRQKAEKQLLREKVEAEIAAFKAEHEEAQPGLPFHSDTLKKLLSKRKGVVA